MKIHELRPPDGAHRERRRVGRGLGSGRGKTSGKGVKGQKARAGGGVPPYFEGGQLPLVRKLPYRRGFKNPFRVEYEVVNLDQLDALADSSAITPETLRAAGLIGKGSAPVKVLARGAVSKKLTVHAHRFSVAARNAIVAAGGFVVEIGGAARAPDTEPVAASVPVTEPVPASVPVEEAPAAASEPDAPPEVSAPVRRRRSRAAAEKNEADLGGPAEEPTGAPEAEDPTNA